MWASLLLLVQDPAALVEGLGSDDIEIRARAEADIVRLGAVAEAALDAASGDADPEVASRARRLLLDVVAPHRREVDRALSHMLSHIGRNDASARALAPLLKRAFPDHPLARADAPPRFTYPTREAWMRSRDGLREAVAATLPAGTSCAACVEWRLETVKVGFAFENAKVEDILGYLREVGGVTLILDAMVSDEAKDLHLDRAVTIEAKDVTLGEALRRVLRPYGMGFAVMEEEGVVLIGTRVKTVD